MYISNNLHIHVLILKYSPFNKCITSLLRYVKKRWLELPCRTLQLMS